MSPLYLTHNNPPRICEIHPNHMLAVLAGDNQKTVVGKLGITPIIITTHSLSQKKIKFNFYK